MLGAGNQMNSCVYAILKWFIMPMVKFSECFRACRMWKEKRERENGVFMLTTDIRTCTNHMHTHIKWHYTHAHRKWKWTLFPLTHIQTPDIDIWPTHTQKKNTTKNSSVNSLYYFLQRFHTFSTWQWQYGALNGLFFHDFSSFFSMWLLLFHVVDSKWKKKTK